MKNAKKSLKPMKNAKKSTPEAARTRPPAVGQPAAPRAGQVLQPKAAAPSPFRKTPAPPPVYRPQPAPKVLQQKSQLPQPRQPQPAPQAAAGGARQTPSAPPAYRPATPPKVLQAKPAVPVRARGGVIQRAEAPVGGGGGGDEGWSTVGRSKAKLSVEERAERRDASMREIVRLAQGEVNAYRPRGAESTFCVFLDVNGRLVSTGESGWSKSGKGEAIGRLLDNHVVKTKGQASGYGGIACAEPEAVINADADGRLGSVCYSLAYDLKSGGSKSACGSCKPLLAKYGITDLYPEMIRLQ